MKDAMVDVLRVEGIMSQGFGLSPKLVMRDKRLTPEAKCIYAYLCSFAGNGNQAFPSRDIMLDELGMSVNRYYRHLHLLLDFDYIRIERVNVEGSNLKGKNIYTIVSLPDPARSAGDAEEKMSDVSEEKTGKKFKIRRKKLKYNSQQTEKDSVKQLIKEKDIYHCICEKTCIDDFEKKETDLEKVKIIKLIKMSLKDMCTPAVLRVGGTTRHQTEIHEILLQLGPEHIRMILRNLTGLEGDKIKNKKAYIMTCILNSVYDLQFTDAEHEDARKVVEEIKRKRQLEEEQQKRIKAEKEKIYHDYPELKDLDQQISVANAKRVKAILEKNNIKEAQLKKELEILNKSRKLFLEKHQLRCLQNEDIGEKVGI